MPTQVLITISSSLVDTKGLETLPSTPGSTKSYQHLHSSLTSKRCLHSLPVKLDGVIKCTAASLGLQLLDGLVNIGTRLDTSIGDGSSQPSNQMDYREIKISIWKTFRVA